jgi:hypothetical protein
MNQSENFCGYCSDEDSDFEHIEVILEDLESVDIEIDEKTDEIAEKIPGFEPKKIALLGERFKEYCFKQKPIIEEPKPIDRKTQNLFNEIFVPDEFTVERARKLESYDIPFLCIAILCRAFSIANVMLDACFDVGKRDYSGRDAFYYTVMIMKYLEENLFNPVTNEALTSDQVTHEQVDYYYKSTNFFYRIFFLNQRLSNIPYEDPHGNRVTILDITFMRWYIEVFRHNNFLTGHNFYVQKHLMRQGAVFGTDKEIILQLMNTLDYYRERTLAELALDRLTNTQIEYGVKEGKNNLLENIDTNNWLTKYIDHRNVNTSYIFERALIDMNFVKALIHFSVSGFQCSKLNHSISFLCERVKGNQEMEELMDIFLQHDKRTIENTRPVRSLLLAWAFHNKM